MKYEMSVEVVKLKSMHSMYVSSIINNMLSITDELFQNDGLPVVYLLD